MYTRIIRLLISPITLIKLLRTEPTKYHIAAFSTQEVYELWRSVCKICNGVHTDEKTFLCQSCKRAFGLHKPFKSDLKVLPWN